MNHDHKLSFRLDFDLWTRLIAYCNRHGTKPSAVLRDALEEFLFRAK